MPSYDIMAGFGVPGDRRVGAFSANVYICPLCLTSYDDPVTLQCGHTFCKRCLSQRADGNLLKCPTCLRLIDLGDHGTEALPSTYLTNDILKFVTLPSPDEGSRGSSHITTSQPPWPTKSHTNIPYCQSCRSDITSSKVCITQYIITSTYWRKSNHSFKLWQDYLSTLVITLQFQFEKSLLKCLQNSDISNFWHEHVLQHKTPFQTTIDDIIFVKQFLD